MKLKSPHAKRVQSSPWRARLVQTGVNLSLALLGELGYSSSESGESLWTTVHSSTSWISCIRDLSQWSLSISSAFTSSSGVANGPTSNTGTGKSSCLAASTRRCPPTMVHLASVKWLSEVIFTLSRIPCSSIRSIKDWSRRKVV